jgi:hypothetical protein
VSVNEVISRNKAFNFIQILGGGDIETEMWVCDLYNSIGQYYRMCCAMLRPTTGVQPETLIRFLISVVI